MESASPIIEAALQQMRGQLLPRAPIRVVLNHVMVSALRATQEAERDEVSPGGEVAAQGRGDSP